MSATARKTHTGDQPYSQSNEITTLDDAPPMNPPHRRDARGVRGDAVEANERTALLAGTSREPVEAVETGVVKVRKPWVLRIDLWIAVLLLSQFSSLFLSLCAIQTDSCSTFSVANGYFWTMSLASVKSPYMQHTSLPPHRGSMFLPIWISFLSCVTNT